MKLKLYILLVLISAWNILADDFIILIDAGSSGSRVHVISYEDTKPIPKLHPSINKKEKPGLSSFAEYPSKAGESLRGLLEFAKANIPEIHWKKTPVHLQATAGLRSIQPEQALAILEDVRDMIQSYPFVFRREWAKIITGTQEGLNGWVTANYLLGVFDHVAALPPSSTTGLVEMGGASLQLSFAPLNAEHFPAGALHEVSLGAQRFHVYAHSHLDFGLEAAQRLLQHRAVDQIEERGNPCFPKDLRHSSTGSHAECLSLLEAVVPTRNCSLCALNRVFQPPVSTSASTLVSAVKASEGRKRVRDNEDVDVGPPRFLAIENFFYTSSFFGISDDQEAATTAAASSWVEQLSEKGAEFCSRSWSDLRSQYASEPPADLSKYCFSSAYIPRILQHGFGFRPPFSNVQVARTVNGVAIDWAIGAALLELVAFQQQYAASSSSGSSLLGGPGSGASSLLSLLLLGLVFLLVGYLLYRVMLVRALSASPVAPRGGANLQQLQLSRVYVSKQ